MPCTLQAEATAQRKTLQEKRREARRSQLKRNLKRLADSVMRVLQTWNGDSDDDRIDIDQFRTGQRGVGLCAAASHAPLFCLLGVTGRVFGRCVMSMAALCQAITDCQAGTRLAAHGRWHAAEGR